MKKEEIQEWILKYIKDKLNIQEVDLTQTFLSIGFYGKVARDFCHKLSSWLKIEISPVLLWEFTDINSLCEHLVNGRQKKYKVTKKKKNDEDIAIIGISCSLPAGITNIDQFWDLLSNGKESISKNIRWDNSQIKTNTEYGHFLDKIDTFDAEFFSIPTRTAEEMDPQHRLLLENTMHAFEDAAIRLLA